jgi:hypothetical protein
VLTAYIPDGAARFRNAFFPFRKRFGFLIHRLAAHALSAFFRELLF